jgi:predicted metal-binding membrane protein
LRCRRLPTPAAGPALTQGLLSGLVSVGSCGVLMLVLFVAGVMSAAAMVALTALLVLERVAPARLPVSGLAGATLILCAIWRVGF